MLVLATWVFTGSLVCMSGVKVIVARFIAWSTQQPVAFFTSLLS